MNHSTPNPSERIYFAQKMTRQETGAITYLNIFTSLKLVKLCGSRNPIVRLAIRERQDGDKPSEYCGWISADHPDVYSMVYRSKIFEICFPYGSRNEELRGKGKKVELVIEELPYDVEAAENVE